MKKFLSSIIIFCVTTMALHASDTISVVVVGDIVMGINYPENNKKLPQNDGADLFALTRDFISSADFAIGNLEGVLLDKGGTPKSCRSNCYRFRMPEHYAQHLYDAGFRVLNVANNHSHDFGDAGVKSTSAALAAVGLKCMGYKNICETTEIEVNGKKIGICGFAPNNGTVSINDYAHAVDLVKQLRSNCDFVIVSMHGGAEGATKNHVTRQREIFLGENRGNVYEFAHKMIDAGADMVFGHGPHVVRGVELYKNKFVAYSLGNFCTPFGVNKNGRTGYAPLIKIEMDENGNFVGGKILSAIQTGSNGPVPDAEKKVVDEIRTLSKADFPESAINIDIDGNITILK